MSKSGRVRSTISRRCLHKRFGALRTSQNSAMAASVPTRINKQCESDDPLPSNLLHVILPALPVQDGDTIIRSSDRVLFYLFRKDVMTYAGAFPLILQPSHTINLPEPARVLEVVFQYFRPNQYPDLPEDNEFNLLVSIANAVEKYKVYEAMHSCTARLR